MSVYAVSSELLRNIKEPKPYFNELLIVFTFSTNPLKVGVDTGGKILDEYAEIASKNPLVATWIQIMSNQPENFEPICEISDLDLKCRTELYIKLAKEVVGSKRLIVSTKQELRGFNFNGGKICEYEGIELLVLDKDEALLEVHKIISQSHTGAGDNVAGNKKEYKL